MPLRCLAFLAGLFVLVPSPARGDDAKDLKILATAKNEERNYAIGPVNLRNYDPVVVRNAEELVALTNKAKTAKDAEVQKEIEGQVAKLLKVETIDWSKQMIIVGVVESLDSLKIDGKVLTVNYTKYYERPVRAIPPTPKFVLLVERHEGEVKLVGVKSKLDPNK